MGFFNKVETLEIISGKEQIGLKSNLTNMIEVAPGIVIFDNIETQYVYQGFMWNQNHKRSAGKAATGAIVGGVLTGGIGAIAGGAIGAKKKDNSHAVVSLLRISDSVPVQLIVKCDKKKASKLGGFVIGRV
ncbi:hypothetical protein A0I81_10110 [Listeria monocytogenes]|uniref:hypothetical protein n=1 Tax=Listeria monocytogenes TaxID=1639 RepID=UPI000BDEF494|nr:hypothetical protein [Listeria monocytogenes]EAE2750796.1 hypothetical protein [Listeria monocytogenes]EAE4263408.1 hypothetical protein [Listeria monocytogenes]EAE4811122.1 hypothetical protein [Listeria monocytogenes]EAE5205033.1 hypothetical protein [Listeria monocytogenes]EAE5559708.1 hypothetical protein [Listeria monocytogenes]